VQYQTFRGSDVHEALLAVREALGADALIESTRQVTNGRDGALGSSFVEVVAAPSPGPSVASGSSGGTLVRPPKKGDTGFKPKADLASMQRELLALRNMVDELSAAQPPKERVRAMLYAAGFEGELAKKIAAGSHKVAKAGREPLRKWLRDQVGQRLRVEPRIIQRPYRQVVACVGPTGVGKTTTLAKLAAIAKLDFGRSVSVITLDTFRVGAVEQWRRYAELLGVGFSVAQDATSFKRLVDTQSSDLVLVDTAGTSTHDHAANAQLTEALRLLKNGRHEVLLTLPAWIRARDAERIALSYNGIELTGLIMTKVDEAEQFAGCLHAAIAANLPVTYLCDGARVPEDIHDPALDAILDSLFPELA
jgi:flagellar biosynthesis protein FlhF